MDRAFARTIAFFPDSDRTSLKSAKFAPGSERVPSLEGIDYLRRFGIKEFINKNNNKNIRSYGRRKTGPVEYEDGDVGGGGGEERGVPCGGGKGGMNFEECSTISEF